MHDDDARLHHRGEGRLHVDEHDRTPVLGAGERGHEQRDREPDAGHCPHVKSVPAQEASFVCVNAPAAAATPTPAPTAPATIAQNHQRS